MDSIASTNQREVKEEKGVEGEQESERELRDGRMYVNTARHVEKEPVGKHHIPITPHPNNKIA